MTTKNCFCFNFRTGNIIIAWSDVLLYIIGIFTPKNAQNTQWSVLGFFIGFLSLYAIYKVMPMIECHPTNRLIKIFSFFWFVSIGRNSFGRR